MKNIKEKISFIVAFIISYFFLLTLGLAFFGKSLINIEIELIKLILSTPINYDSFVFVAECSGIVAISCYLAIIIGLYIIKQYRKNIKWINVIYSCIFLFIWNIIRIVLVLLSERISFSFAEVTHVLFWFVTFILIVWLTTKSVKKK